jgi:hypothetical protein
MKMGMRYICDVCAKEYDVKGAATSQVGYQTPIPEGWAAISIFTPAKPSEAPKPLVFQPNELPVARIVCSQACAERVLDEAKELLRAAFEKLR